MVRSAGARPLQTRKSSSERVLLIRLTVPRPRSKGSGEEARPVLIVGRTQLEWRRRDPLTPFWSLAGLCMRPGTSPPHRLVLALQGGPKLSYRPRLVGPQRPRDRRKTEWVAAPQAIVAVPTQVEWVPGFPSGSRAAGQLLVWFVAFTAGTGLASKFGGWPYPLHTLTDWLILIAAMAVCLVPATLAYWFMAPTAASLGIMSDGLIVKAGSGQLGFCQGYRWADLRLRGRYLILPRIPPTVLIPLRLTATQFARVASRIVPTNRIA
jgi:hypothetical protein